MKPIYKKFAFSTLFLLGFILASVAQNPTVQNGVATYHSNKNIGRKFEVPEEWDKIVINANVTITGSFYMPTRTAPIEIMGKDRKTSIIQGDGSRPTDDGIKGRSYSAIRADKDPDVYIHDLKITKPMKFHIGGGFGNVTVERCDIIAGSETHTTDGIHGGVGKTIIKDCYIDVFDDALYTIECKLVENTTIVHNSNGGPFMTSWGASAPANHTCVVRNCKVIGNSTGYYAHGVFSWAQKNEDFAQTIHIKIEGSFDYVVNPGKAAAPMYTIARPYNSNNTNAVRPPDVKNATIRIDGKCPAKNSIELRPTAQNCKVTFENCDNASYIFIDHNSSGKRLRGGTDNLVSTQVGGVGDMVQWEQQATDNGYFFLIHKATGRKLQGSSSYVVSLVDPSKNGTWEQWKWVDAGSGWYRLENRAHQRWLQVDADGISNWTIAPKTSTGNNTKWKYAKENSSSLRKGVAEIEEKHAHTLYANPVSSILDISGLNASSVVEVYRLTGQKIISSKGESKINVSGLASGIYLVRINQSTTLKFIKE